eukprot:153129-Rhodomonas_salina.1
MEGAITAYRVIRQIASNAKTAEEMALLAPFVSDPLLEVCAHPLSSPHCFLARTATLKRMLVSKSRFADSS